MLVGSAIGGAETAVAGAIRNAASATGTSFEYLLATAKVESGLNPSASAKTSSAQGLFQFVDSTWLSTLKQAGPALGYGKYSAAIVQDDSGHLSVPDAQMRQKILALREDPAANAAMAGAFTRSNAAQLADKLGRKPSEGELYMAHFLGANGASRLISLAATQPNAPAANAFPRAAHANRSIFYDTQGNARSASGVYATLAGRYDTARASFNNVYASLKNAATSPPIAPSAAAANVTPLSNLIAAAAAGGDTSAVRAAAGLPRPSVQSLFSSDGRDGAVSQVVRDLWTSRPHVAAALTGVEAPPAAFVAAAAAPASSASDAPPRASAPTPIERVQNLFNDLLSSIHS